MKLEAEVNAFGAEGARGRADPAPTAQERRPESIGRPEWQPPGCGGCGTAGGPTAEEDRRSCSGSLFDCEHFQFIDDDDDEGVVICDDEAAAPPGAAEPVTGRSDDMGEPQRPAPRSVLKRPGEPRASRARNRVTFDEAVALYSDEGDGAVRLLQLTTGPDVIYSDCYYMFEPPIEYRDLPPFEPPAEYRDSSDGPGTPTNEPSADEPRPNVDDGAKNVDVPDEPAPADQTQRPGDEPVENRTEGDDAVPAGETGDGVSGPEVVAPRAEPEDPALESDKVFERFLEAEREFAVDEELNSVFCALESDFAGDDRNGGALDDNFFRKLITLLSAAEGGPAPEGDAQPRSEPEDDDSSQAQSSRTLSEADSDCSISSQDTIIVRLGEGDDDQTSGDSVTLYPSRAVDANGVGAPPERRSNQERLASGLDEVFSESASSSDENPRPPQQARGGLVSQVVAQMERAASAEESLSRQSSGEQSSASQEAGPPQDADDSTSSDSRSGEVEEEIRLDDIGYDEEDAEDYDEESFRGIARGSSKIRRIIKKNALQCTLFRGIEAKRRQAPPGAKYPRPKSPLLSQESLVEKLKWLTTMDDHHPEGDPPGFRSKPPDVILSAGGAPVNGAVPAAPGYPPRAPYYAAQPRLVLPPAPGQGGYYLRRDGFPAVQHPSLPRQRAYAGHPSPAAHNTLPHPPSRAAAHPQQQQQWPEQQQQHQQRSSMTMPRSFRDWRVIQRLMGGRSGGSSSGGGEGGGRSAPVQADYVRSPNGSISAYPVPPDVSRTGGGGGQDELEQFVEKDSRRLELIRRRYSVAEPEEEDPTFGFARRPSVKGVQKQIHAQSKPPPEPPQADRAHAYAAYDGGPPYPRPAYAYGRDPYGGLQPIYEPAGRAPVPMHVHRASVALTELPGSATIPYAHRKPPQDVRYHSYAESVYGSARTLPTHGWPPPPVVPQPPPMLQVPLHAAKDERGVPEGASSSPKITSDSLYHGGPVPDAVVPGGAHQDDGMIYYSLNV